jgi:hypothetical protein
MRQWDFDKMKVGTMRCWNTAKAMNNTLDNTAVSDNGDGTVDIAITANGFDADSEVRIKGTTNYDGIHRVITAATNAITILATYVAETPAGTETISPAIGIGCDGIGDETAYMLLDVRLTLSAAGDTSEDFTATQDSFEDAKLDNQFITFDTNGEQYYSSVVAGMGKREYEAGDYVDFAWPNGGTARNWGLEVKYGVM